MVMMAEPIIKTLKKIHKKQRGHVIYLSPQGKKLNQKKIISMSKLKNITLICGRYEGIDQRIIDKYVDEEVSIGDFVLSGGEYAAICLIDAISRHIPGTLAVSYTHLRAHETSLHLVCRLLLEKKNNETSLHLVCRLLPFPYGVVGCFFFLMIRRPPRSTQGVSSAASDVYKRQV